MSFFGINLILHVVPATLVTILHSLFLILYVCLMVYSAESGSEGSSDASDENNNQQVCVYA